MKATLGDRSLFPDLRAFAYLNHAAISPPSLPVQQAIQAVVTDYAEHGVGAVGRWVAQRGRLRGLLAQLIGAQPEDLGFVTNTSAGVTHIATCLPWRSGERILLFSGEFPTNVTPWQLAAQRHGLQVELLPLDGFGDGSGDGLARVEAALRAGGVRLVAVSAVQFQTGLRMPTDALAALCHRYGAEIFVDAIQCIGGAPFQVGTLDYVAGGGHKWLMGTEGSGFLYVRPDRVAALQPWTASWLSHGDGGMDFLFEGAGHLRYDRPIRQRADFVEGGVMSSITFAALEAAVDLIADLSPQAIAAHVQHYHDLLEPELLARGFRSARSPDPAARSGLLCAVPPAHVSLKALHQALGERGVSTSTPDGHLRFSPHWPNSPHEVPPLLDALDEALASLPPA